MPCLVIAQLQSSLNMERGGEVARNLACFYGLVRAGLTEAQLKQSSILIERADFSNLTEVHEAWLEVERGKPPNQIRPVPPVPIGFSGDLCFQLRSICGLDHAR